MGKLFDDIPLEVGYKNVVAVKYSPEIFPAFRWVGRAFVATEMRRGIQDVFIVGHVIRAGSTAFTGTNHLWLELDVLFSFFDVEAKYLIAFQSPGFVVALESERFSVKAPVGFGIVTSIGELCDVAQVFTFRCLCNECPAQNEHKDSKIRFHVVLSLIAAKIFHR